LQFDFACTTKFDISPSSRLILHLSTNMAASLLPRLSSPTLLSAVSFRQFTQKLLPTLSIAIPGVSLNLPTIDDIWESVLRAVPKNKVSHSRKRHRQMAGKALKDQNGLCKCPGCGQPKRTHRLCQHCLEGMLLDYCSCHYHGQQALTECRNEANVATGLPQ
jgi:large subunit ribosomal protein L32